MDYGDVVYDAMGTVDSRKLQVLQNQCLRICCNSDPRTPINDLHANCKMPKLEVCRKLHVCNFVHAGLSDKSSNKVNSMFEVMANQNAMATRAGATNVLKVPPTRLKTCEQNVRIRGAKYFNELPVDIRMAPSSGSFKARAKKHLYGPPAET